MKKTNTPDTDKIPVTLDECYPILSTLEGNKEWIRLNEDDAVTIGHHTIGRAIRNKWYLWEDKNSNNSNPSILRDSFNLIGIWHADDMSSIILRSFHRWMNKKEIKIEEQIKYYKDFWEKQDNDTVHTIKFK